MDTLLFGVPLVAIVVGLTEVVKRAGLNNRYTPVVALFFGVALSLVVNLSTGIALENIITGLVLGLTASGIWSSTKTTVLNK